MKKILSIILLVFMLLNTSLSFAKFSVETKLSNKKQEAYKKQIDKVYKNLDNKLSKLSEEKKISNIEKISKKIDKLLLKKLSDKNNFVLSYLNYLLKNKLEKWNTGVVIEEVKSNEYNLIKVLDWDTISIDYNWEERKVRLIWINAPETKNVSYNSSCLWIETKEFLMKKLENISKVTIEFDESQWKSDSFWRLLWYLYLSWTNINKVLLEEWLATEYTYNNKKPYKYQQDFIDANNNSKINKKWIYSDKCNLNSDLNTNTWSNLNENIKVINTEINSNVYYTSSHYTSKLYYCENDSSWESLSKKYLQKYNSEKELLKKYSYKTLHQPCN